MKLQDLVELEGSGKDLAGLVGSGVAEIRLAILLTVRHFYRPARKMLRSALESERESGYRRMEAFADAMLVMSEQAEDKGDVAAHFLALHNAASAMYWRAQQASTTAANLYNRGVLGQASTLPTTPGGDDEADLKFLRAKAWAGLMENDGQFAGLVTIEGWCKAVDEMAELRFPDFPGRAVVLAKKLAMVSRLEDAITLLRRATEADFGKEDQRADARDFLAELTGHRS